MARNNENEVRIGSSYALAVGLVLATIAIGASFVYQQKQRRLRGEIQERPKPPPLVLDLTVEDLREPGYVAELAVGSAMRVRASASPSAGIFWKAAVVDVGPEGSPVAIKSKLEEGQASYPGAPIPQSFQITAVRPGTASIVITATDPSKQVVDSVRLQIIVE